MVAAVLKKVTAVESVLLLLAIRYLVFFSVLCCVYPVQPCDRKDFCCAARVLYSVLPGGFQWVRLLVVSPRAPVCILYFCVLHIET